MASSCSTSFAPSFPMKIVPYVPRAPKPKPKSKAKSTATTKTAEHSRLGVSSPEDDGEWFHIDDFPMPDSSASHSLGPAAPTLFGAADASSSLDVAVGASESGKPKHYRSDRESLDRGTDHATKVEKTNLALNGLYDGNSPEFPLILESDATEEHSTMQVKPSNGYHAAASAEGHHAVQHGDFAASMPALSVEDMEGIRHKPSPAEDEPPFGDIDMTSRSLLTCKRKHSSPGDTTISSAEVPDTSEPELEDPRLAKRRRPSEQQAESLVLDHAHTPKPTSLPISSNEPSPGPRDNDSQGGGAGGPAVFPNNFDEENGEHGARTQGIFEELLHSPRQPISPLERVEGEMNGKGSDDEAGESHEDERVDEVSGRPSSKNFQRSKRRDRPVQKRGHGQSRTTLKRRSWSTMTTRTSRNVTSFQPRQLSKPRTDSATWSFSPRTSSLGTKAGGGTNENHEPSVNMAYQLTDFTHCHVPEGSSIVTATVCCSESNLSLNSIALDHKLLGGEGKIIRMTQLSPDSWMLLGYRYDGGPGACTRESPTLLDADWTNNPLSDAASHGTEHLDGDEDEEYENREEEEDPGEYRPHAASRGQRTSRGDMRPRKRTRVPWLESDDLRLLAYRKNMGMEWKDIFELFPDRTPGAVRMRWHMLRGNDPSLSTQTLASSADSDIIQRIDPLLLRDGPSEEQQRSTSHKDAEDASARLHSHEEKPSRYALPLPRSRGGNEWEVQDIDRVYFKEDGSLSCNLLWEPTTAPVSSLNGALFERAKELVEKEYGAEVWEEWLERQDRAGRRRRSNRGKAQIGK